MPPPVATTTTAHSTWHPVYTVLLHRALVKYRLQHVVSGTDVRTFRVTVAAPTTPPSANIDASVRPRDIGVRLAYRLHEPTTPNAPFTLPFYDGTRLVVTPITDFVRKSRFRSAHVAVDPAQPPTRSWQDFEPARSAICTAYAEAVTGAQLAQYQRAQGDALPPDSAPLLTNPRFPSLPLTLTRGTALQRVCYDQLDYTCGDWSDLWYHAMYGSYTRMRAPTVRTPGPVAPRVKAAMATLRPLYFGDRSPYVTLSPATTHATLSYVFQHLQKGVFVRFRGGTLDAFIPFCRHNFNNTVYDQYYLAGSPHDRAQLQEMRRLEAALRTFDTRHRDPDTASPTDKALYTRQLGRLLELETVCAQRYARAHRARHPTDLKANPNRRQWLPNNHFVNQAVYLNNPNVHHFRYLLTTLAAHRTLPDAEFVLNLRDHPVLRGTYQATTDTTTVYNPYPDLETDPHAPPTLLRTVRGGLAPILSHTGKDGYADIALPTIDDIQHYSQRVFLDQCSTNYIDEASKTPFQPTNNRPDSLWVDWHAKTVTKAVFRGSGTGRGTTPVVNQWLAVWRLAHTPAYCDILDVELTSLNRKPKVIAGDAGLQYLDTKDVQAVCQSRIDRKRHFLGLVERSRYKYVLCLDGQTRADRMLNEMRTGSLVILPTPPLPHAIVCAAR